MFHHKLNLISQNMFTDMQEHFPLKTKEDIDHTSKNVSHSITKLPVFSFVCFLSVLSACEKESTDIVRVILVFGGSVNQRCHLGWTALHEAVRRGNTQLCEALLQAGAAVDATNVYGITPLIEAARHGKTEIVNYLISKGTLNLKCLHHFIIFSRMTGGLVTEIPNSDIQKLCSVGVMCHQVGNSYLQCLIS